MSKKTKKSKKGKKKKKTASSKPQIALGQDRYLHHLDNKTLIVIAMFLIAAVVIVYLAGDLSETFFWSTIIIGKGKSVVEYFKKNRSG